MADWVQVVRHPVPGGRGFVAQLVLDRPAALNALSTDLAGQLRDAFTMLSGQADQADVAAVRAVVVSSSQPRAFCVGADLKERNTFTDDQLLAQRLVYQAMARSLLDVPVPVLAAVAGYALGGGFELALLCDLVVADATAVLGLPEVSVGLVPGLGGTQLLARRVGPARAADLILTARRIDAAQGLALGAVDRLVDAGQADSAALELATTIAGHSPVGVRNAKRAIRLGVGAGLAAGLAIEDDAWRATAFSADRVEGIRAFVQKRPPVW